MNNRPRWIMTLDTVLPWIFYPLSQDVIKPNHLIKIDLLIHTVDLFIRKYKLPTSRQDKLLFFNILKYIFSALIRQEHLF